MICFYFVVLLHCLFFYIALCESPFIVLVKTNLPFFRTRKCNSWAKKIKSELVWSEFLGNFEVMGDLIPIIEGPAKIRDGKKVRNKKVWFKYPQDCQQNCSLNCSRNCRPNCLLKVPKNCPWNCAKNCLRNCSLLEWQVWL